MRSVLALEAVVHRKRAGITDEIIPKIKKEVIRRLAHDKLDAQRQFVSAVICKARELLRPILRLIGDVSLTTSGTPISSTSE